MKNLLYSSFFFCCLLFCYSCGSDDAPETEQLPMSIVWSINESDYNVTDINTVYATMVTSQVEGIDIRYLDIEVELPSGSILDINCQNIRELEEEGIRSKVYSSGNEDCQVANQDSSFVFSLCEKGDASFESADGDIWRTDITDPIGTLTISSNDTEAKVVSGSFNVQVRIFGNTQDETIPLEGTFENIPYLKLF